MCWAFPQGEGPKVPSTMFERNLFLNPVIRITIMVFVDIKIASIVIGGREAPKAEGLFIWLDRLIRYLLLRKLRLQSITAAPSIYKCLMPKAWELKDWN